MRSLFEKEYYRFFLKFFTFFKIEIDVVCLAFFYVTFITFLIIGSVKFEQKTHTMKVIIIGGVAGGATSTARLRRLNEENHIVVFEKIHYISYANCGLPYYIGGTIEERDNLFVQTPEEFGRRYNLDVRVSTESVKH